MKEEIIKLEEELRLAMIANDVNKLNGLISDSLSFISPDGSVVTKEIDLEAHRNKIQKITKLNPSEQKINFIDNVAIVTVKMYIEGCFLENPIDGNYRYIRIWMKQDNNWQVIAGSTTKIIN